MSAFDKCDVARRQLETALQLYFGGGDMFSIITLAGASEELLGKLVASRGIQNSLASLQSAVSAMHLHLFGSPLAPKHVAERANLARNHLKHLEVGGASEVSLDWAEDARDMLQRAIDNYWLLNEALTPAMERFQRQALAG